MSSILKALQKLEEDRATRRQGPPDITSGLLKSTKPRRPRTWLMPVSLLAVAAGTALATYIAMGGFSRSSPPVAPVPVSPQASRPETARDVVPAAVAPPGPTSSHRQPASVPAPAKRTAASSPISPTAPASGNPAQRALGESAKAPEAVALPAQPSPTAAASFRVSGIAWQKDSASRFAVVNGQTLMEGGVIEGVRVEKIFPDRVRFSRDGHHFDVPLGTAISD